MEIPKMRMPEVLEVEEIPQPPPEREQEEIFEEVKPSKKVEIKNEIEEIKNDIEEPKEERGDYKSPRTAEKQSFSEQKPIKKKREMTEKQKEALRLGREKSLETRRQLKAKKDEVIKKKKQIKELEKEKVEIQYNKAVNQLEAEKEVPKKEIIETPRTVEKVEPKKYYLTEDEINNISTKAISNYEIIRKTRKEEKRRRQEQEKAEAEIAKTIRAYNSTYTMRF